LLLILLACDTFIHQRLRWVPSRKSSNKAVA
jgi:hypothetical protein